MHTHEHDGVVYVSATEGSGADGVAEHVQGLRKATKKQAVVIRAFVA